MSDRLSQVSGHLSNNHPRGLLAGEVAIITGACVGSESVLLYVVRGAGH